MSPGVHKVSPENAGPVTWDVRPLGPASEEVPSDVLALRGLPSASEMRASGPPDGEDTSMPPRGRQAP